MRAGTLLLIVSLAAVPCLASDSPDSQLDATTGLIHTVDSRVSGSSQVIRHVVDPGEGQPTATDITAGHVDHAPRLAIGGDSVVHVVWQRDLAGGQVRTVSIAADGTLVNERALGDASEDSRNPEIALYGSVPCAAFEVHGGSGIGIAVQFIVDDPDPTGPGVVVGTTSFSGDLDLRIQAAEGALWTTWRDGADSLGYSVYDAGTDTWTSQESWPVADGDVATARAEVEKVVSP